MLIFDERLRTIASLMMPMQAVAHNIVLPVQVQQVPTHEIFYCAADKNLQVLLGSWLWRRLSANLDKQVWLLPARVVCAASCMFACLHHADRLSVNARNPLYHACMLACVYRLLDFASCSLSVLNACMHCGSQFFVACMSHIAIRWCFICRRSCLHGFKP